ncbi:unnamed protein product, partial [Polarella glacialis]
MDAAEADAIASDVAAAQPQELAQEAAAADDLLQQLRSLPAAFPRAPMLWIPRRAKQQVGSIMRTRLAVAAQLANAAPGDAAAETAHLLCRAVAQLLLRSPPQAEEQ